jgi:hypothetical protein
MAQNLILMLDTLNPNEQNPWVKRKGIDEIPRGDGGGRRGETGDALGWTGIEGQGLPTRRVLFTLREKGRRCVFHGDANEGVRMNMEKIRPRGCFGSARAHREV